MKGAIFSTFFLGCCFIFSQNQQIDSINILDEVTLIEAFISKKAIGITESSSVGIAELEQFSPIDFAGGLNQISGLYVLSGALNTNRITIRGVGSRSRFETDKVRMYFNGIPVTNGTGVSTIEAYDFENIGRIEVVKGPKASSLGANLGGALVLNTKPPIVGETLLQNSFTVGSYNLIKNNLAFRLSEKNFNINFNYNHIETDGFRQNNSFERDGFLLTSSLRLNAKNKLDFLVNHIDYTAGIPSAINEIDFREDPQRAASIWLAARGFETNNYTLAGISHNHQFHQNLKTTNSIFYTYLDHFEPSPFEILDEYTHGYGFRSVTKGKLFAGHFTLGGELYRDNYYWKTFENRFRENNGNGFLKGEQELDNKEIRSQLNLFGSYEISISKNLLAQIGINLNTTTYRFFDQFNTGDANTSAKRNFDPIVLPNFNLQYALKNGHLFANMSKGFSNPGIRETLNPNRVLNLDINQEKGISYEVGGSFALFENALTLNTSLYRMNITDLLVSERLDEVRFIGKNAGSTRHQGFELDMNYLLKVTENWLLLPRFSYTFNDHIFVDFVDGDNDFSGNELTGVPAHLISSGLTLQHATGFILNLTHQFVDEISLTDSNTQFSDSFNVFNAQIRYQTTVFNSLQLGLNIGLNNLFDTNYAQSVLINQRSFTDDPPRFFYPSNGRNYYSSIRLTYRF